MFKTRLLLFATGFLMADNSYGLVRGLSLGLNFGAEEHPFAINSGTLASNTVAGVFPQANWNNLYGASGSVLNLNTDNRGSAAASSVSVTWSCPNTWSTTGRGQENNGFLSGTGDRALMTGYLDTTDQLAGTATVTLSGLGPEFTTGGYDVIVYILGGAGGLGGGYTIGSTTKYGTAPTNPLAHAEDAGVDLKDTGTYVRFEDLSGSSFTLTAEASAGPGKSFRAPINAIQIVRRRQPATTILTPDDALIPFDFDVSTSGYLVNEGAPSAIDADVNTKYLNFGERNSGFIVTPQAGPVAVQSFVIVTAKDLEDRDPAAWALYGTSALISSTDNSDGQAESWTLVAQGTLNLPTGRNTVGPLVAFSNPDAYSSYRMVFPAVKNWATANAMQFAEIRFFASLDGTGPAVLTPGDPIIAIDLPMDQSESPLYEESFRAIDGDSNTKYLNFGRENSGFIVTPSVGLTTLTGFTMTTANDASERDPVGWELYGTRDPIVSPDHSAAALEDWTLISAGTLDLPLARLTPAPPMTFANQTAYRAYRFVVTTVRNPATANAMQFSEIQFQGEVSPSGSPLPNGPGNALSFDGVNDYVDVPDGYWFTGDFTVEGWVYPSNHNSFARLLDFGNGPFKDNVLVALSAGTSGQPHFGVYSNSFGGFGITAPDPLPLNQWSHLACVLRGTTGIIYVNGVAVASGTLNRPRTVLRTGCYLGRSNWAADGYANAALDEVRLWNVARTTAHIRKAMRRQLFGSENGLIAYYRLDEGGGLSAFDATGNSGHTASLALGAAWLASTVAPFAPTVVTLPANSLTLTGATVNASANPHTTSTTGYFEWGTNTKFGHATPTLGLGSGVGSVNWNHSLEGLIEGATYHYRATASNVHGASYGAGLTFSPGRYTVSTTNDSGPGSLRQAIQDLGSGGTVTFASNLLGKPIKLTSGEIVINKDLTIQGPGVNALTDSILIHGGTTNRAFYISSGRVRIADIMIVNCRVTGTNASDMEGYGLEGSPGESVVGGAILNAGKLTVTNCLFYGNSAFGGRGSWGGGDSTLIPAGNGGPGGAASGGAICNSNLLTLLDCRFWGNATSGGAGRLGGVGVNYAVDATGGTGGAGGAASGGAIYNLGNLLASNCSFYLNVAFGGAGADGGNGRDYGGPGGAGGAADGGAIINAGTQTLINCTFAEQQTRGGPGGNGGIASVLYDGWGGNGGRAGGGAVVNLRPGTFVNCTIGDNLIDGGDHGVPSQFPGFAGEELGPGLWAKTNATALLNTLLARNRNSTATQDVSGVITSLGHNLVSATNGSSGWVASDLVGASAAPLDAQVARAENNGGPTFAVTMAVTPCSPAVDAGDDMVLASPYSLATDLRGSTRRSSTHVDIGAYEMRFGIDDVNLVENSYDEVPGSLRFAINGALPCSEIRFAPGVTGVITLARELVVNKRIKIIGPIPDVLAISGGNLHRVFRIDPGADVEISGLTIRDGSNATGGGGVLVEGGTLRLTSCILSNNTGGSSDGGALRVNNGATGVVHGCTFAFNSAPNGGAIAALGRVDAFNCTYFANQAGAGSGLGGAVFTTESSAVKLVACTVVSNTAARGGGIFAGIESQIESSIVAWNGPGAGPEADIAFRRSDSRVISLGFNLVGTGGDGVYWSSRDLRGNTASPLDPLLGPFGDNGGPTPTIPLLQCSPALDNGDAGIVGPPFDLLSDQRGQPRQAGRSVDIGAFESRAFPEIIVVVTNLMDNGPGSLRDALSSNRCGTVRFAPELTGTIVLTQGELVLNSHTRIVGPGPDRLSISGNDASRVFKIARGSFVEMSGLTITRGRVQAVGTTQQGWGLDALGGGIWNQGSLMLSNCIILSNLVVGADKRGTGCGGGVYSDGPSFQATKCVFQGNRAQGGRGGAACGGGIFIYSQTGPTTLRNCTINENAAAGGDGLPGVDGPPAGEDGGSGGKAEGGGLLASGPAFLASHCTISSNSAIGGTGASGGRGGGGQGGGGGNGDWGRGGGISLGIIASLVHCTVSHNKAEGGDGANGGAPSGPAGSGGGASGGGVFVSGFVLLTNCTIAFNLGRGGAPGSGGMPSVVEGGGINLDASGYRMAATIVASNIVSGPPGGWVIAPDLALLGPLHSSDHSHNLIGLFDQSGDPGPGDQIGTPLSPINPKLGPLQDNGGPTWTHALLPGSPALDAGKSTELTDQRGGPRILDAASVPNAPGGDGSDIGAVEMGGWLRITDIRTNGPSVDISFTTEGTFPYHLESKDALVPSPWTFVPGSDRTGNGAVLTVPDTRPRSPTNRFYRAVMTP